MITYYPLKSKKIYKITISTIGSSSYNIFEIERKIEEKIFESINSCIKEERFEVAARIYKTLGDSERAKELWEKQQNVR